MNKKNITYDDIRKMSDEEVAALNRELGKVLVKKMAISAALGLAVFATVTYFADKTETDEEN